MYLDLSAVIDFDAASVAAKARELATGCSDNTTIAKRCFEFVRDEIRHTGDVGEGITTCTASSVLENKSGWCYAKSHLLAALLRANGIPAALCYQRVGCSDSKRTSYCLHGLNAVFLEEFGWYRIDARGNKSGINAQFDPPHEHLAFVLQEHESDLLELYPQPLDVVVEALNQHLTYDEMVRHLPDLPMDLG